MTVPERPSRDLTFSSGSVTSIRHWCAGCIPCLSWERGDATCGEQSWRDGLHLGDDSVLSHLRILQAVMLAGGGGARDTSDFLDPCTAHSPEITCQIIDDGTLVRFVFRTDIDICNAGTSTVGAHLGMGTCTCTGTGTRTGSTADPYEEVCESDAAKTR